MKCKHILADIFIVILAMGCFFLNIGYAQENPDDHIVVKSMLANPSKTQSQTIPFKSYLPKEITPESIIDAGGLDIDFDYQKGQYFAHKDFLLGPGETKTVKITVRDVWKISREELEEFRNKSKELFKKLEDTDRSDEAQFFKNSIDSKLSAIDQKMSGTPLTPNQQMQQYREIMEMLKSMKSEMSASQELAEEVERFTPKAAWKIIITIIVSLGLLSSVFFYLWYIKIKPHSSENISEHVISQVRPVSPPEVKKKVAKEEKKAGIADIENILKKKGP